MKSQNYVQVIGRISSDVKIKECEDVHRYSFTVTVKSKDKDRGRPDLVPIIFWEEPSSERLINYKKGDEVIIDGSIRMTSYTKGDIKRWNTDVYGKSISLVDTLDTEDVSLCALRQFFCSQGQILDLLKEHPDFQFSPGFLEQIESQSVVID
jgi:single-stranded DNA-binding protein